jgi:hypothetical protein
MKGLPLQGTAPSLTLPRTGGGGNMNCRPLLFGPLPRRRGGGLGRGQPLSALTRHPGVHGRFPSVIGRDPECLGPGLRRGDNTFRSPC